MSSPNCFIIFTAMKESYTRNLLVFYLNYLIQKKI